MCRSRPPPCGARARSSRRFSTKLSRRSPRVALSGRVGPGTRLALDAEHASRPARHRRPRARVRSGPVAARPGRRSARAEDEALPLRWPDARDRNPRGVLRLDLPDARPDRWPRGALPALRRRARRGSRTRRRRHAADRARWEEGGADARARGGRAPAAGEARAGAAGQGARSERPGAGEEAKGRGAGAARRERGRVDARECVGSRAGSDRAGDADRAPGEERTMSDPRRAQGLGSATVQVLQSAASRRADPAAATHPNSPRSLDFLVACPLGTRRAFSRGGNWSLREERRSLARKEVRTMTSLTRSLSRVALAAALALVALPALAA